MKDLFKDGKLPQENMMVFTNQVATALQQALDKQGSIVSYQSMDIAKFALKEDGPVKDAYDSLGQGSKGKMFGGSGKKAEARQAAFDQALEVAIMNKANAVGSKMAITGHEGPYSTEEIAAKNTEFFKSQGHGLATRPKAPSIPQPDMSGPDSDGIYSEAGPADNTYETPVPGQPENTYETPVPQNTYEVPVPQNTYEVPVPQGPADYVELRDVPLNRNVMEGVKASSAARRAEMSDKMPLASGRRPQRMAGVTEHDEIATDPEGFYANPQDAYDTPQALASQVRQQGKGNQDEGYDSPGQEKRAGVSESPDQKAEPAWKKHLKKGAGGAKDWGKVAEEAAAKANSGASVGNGGKW